MWGVTTTRAGPRRARVAQRVVGGRRLDARARPARRRRAGPPASAAISAASSTSAPRAGVDQDRARLHRRQETRVDHAARRIGQRAVQRHDVGGGQRLGERRARRAGARAASRARRRAPRACRTPRAMRATAPPIAPLPTSTSVLPASSNICLREEAEVGRRGPRARLDGRGVAGDVLREVQHQRQHVLGDRRRRVARARWSPRRRPRAPRRGRRRSCRSPARRRSAGSGSAAKLARRERDLVGQRGRPRRAQRATTSSSSLRANTTSSPSARSPVQNRLVALIGREAVEDDDAHGARSVSLGAVA